MDGQEARTSTLRQVEIRDRPVTKPLGQPPQQARLVLVLPHLGVGGAQRVAVMLANHWAQRGFDIHLVTTLEHKSDFHDLSPLVKRQTLIKPRGLEGEDAKSRIIRVTSEVVRIKSLRELESPFRQVLDFGLRIYRTAISLPRAISFFCIDRRLLGRRPSIYLQLLRWSTWRVESLHNLLGELKPDVVVSFLGQTNILTIAAAQKLPVRLVISERNDPTRQLLANPWQSLRPILYPVADIITANSHGALQQMRAYCPAAKLAYVPNPVMVPDESEVPRNKSILFLARLVHQKGPDILVDAFAKFVRANPDWRLDIAGDGPMEQELVERVEQHGIAEHVVFHGRVKDPTDLLMQSSIFVLPSRFEGTPNALLEAMTARLACIVTDASPGPLNLIKNGVSGLVVRSEDPESLAAALHQLANDAALRERLIEKSWERTSEFHLDSVMEDWTRLLFTGAEKSGKPDGAISGT